MNHLENHPFGHVASYQPQFTLGKEQQIVTTFVLLVAGYYVLAFFDAWPSTLKRALYEFIIWAIPSSFIRALQHVVIKLGRMPPESESLVRGGSLGTFQAKEEAIHRIIGQTSIPAVIQRARTLSGLDKLGRPSTRISPPGLGNWDNSCYQNSVLQGLASLPAFQHYIFRSLQLCQRTLADGKTTEALVTFLGQLADTSQPSQTVWTPAVLKSMDSWQQQDAQEYFSKISDAVEREAITYIRAMTKKLNTGFALGSSGVGQCMNKGTAAQRSSTAVQTLLGSIVTNPLLGLQAQALECQTCKFSEGFTFTHFECLTLALGVGGPCYLEDLIDAYTDPELIDGVECDQCTNRACKVSDGQVVPKEEQVDAINRPEKQRRRPVLSTKAKQITIGRLPKDLIIHVNRSIYDEYGNQVKNSAFVRFPARLDFQGRWCAPIDGEDEKFVQAIYELKCIVTHSGRHDNGHYVAYGKRDKDWYCFNDEIVTKLSEDEVLSRGNVFMLFYEALDQFEASPARDEIFDDAASPSIHTQTIEYAETKVLESTPSIDNGQNVAPPVDSSSATCNDLAAISSSKGKVLSESFLESAAPVAPEAMAGSV